MVAMADVSLLRTFLAVYRAGSISKAAGVVHLTQPAVSKQMRAFEAQLGRPLFTRLPKGIAPTASAHELARAAAPHLDALEAMLGAARSGPGELAGVVLLGGPAELMGARVLPALARLGEQHQITLRARLGLPTCYWRTRRRRAGPRRGHPARGPGRRRVRRVLRRDVRAGRRPRVGAAHSRPPTPRPAPSPVVAGGAAALRAALADVPLVAYAEDLPILRRYWRAVFGTALAGRAGVVVPDLRSVVAAVAAGAGVSVVPRYLADEALASGALVELYAPARAPTNRIFLARRAGRPGAARVAFVREFLLRAADSW
jgi:DNA-binding transcriptional LysR family regulator